MVTQKTKYNCNICDDTGTFTNPFDQEFKCYCQVKPRKKIDYRGVAGYEGAKPVSYYVLQVAIESYRQGKVAVALKVIDKAIKMRLDDKIDRNQFRKKIDIPLNKGGAGMDKRVAKKIARRLELLILGKYK